MARPRRPSSRREWIKRLTARPPRRPSTGPRPVVPGPLAHAARQVLGDCAVARQCGLVVVAARVLPCLLVLTVPGVGHD